MIGKWAMQAIILSVQRCVITECLNTLVQNIIAIWLWQQQRGLCWVQIIFFYNFVLYLSHEALGKKMHCVGLALLSSCSALDISNISLHVDEHFFESLFPWYWYILPCHNSIFVAIVGLLRSATIFNVDCRGNLRKYFTYFSLDVPIFT